MKRYLTVFFFVALLNSQVKITGPTKMIGPSTIQPAATGGQVTLFTDGFTGTATTVLHSYNANYDAASFNNQCNDAVISTPNTAITGNTACDQITGFTWTNDQFIQMTIVSISVSQQATICVRMSPNTARIDGYCAGIGPGVWGGTYRIEKWAAGVESTLFTSAVSAVNGDVMNFQILGTTLTLKVNGTSQISNTDSSFSTGKPGVFIDNGAGTGQILSTLSAGSTS